VAERFIERMTWPEVAEAIERGEGWRELLSRLDPEIAPAADAVRGALGVSRSPG
jgi:hypothetical protein